MRIAAIVQARMSSRRLPGKVLMSIGGKPALGYLLERLALSRELDEVVVATSSDPSDDPIEAYCRRAGVACWRGPLGDVAGRFGEVVEHRGLDGFVRLTADSPLLDQGIVDRGVELFRHTGADLVTNVYPKTFPAGQSVEVVAVGAFRRALETVSHADEREHVTLHFYRHPESYAIRNFTSERDHHALDLSLDTEGDARLIEAILERMERPHTEYSSEEIVELLRKVTTSRSSPETGVKRVRVGVIGLGVGEAHVGGYHAHPLARVTTLCDSHPGRLKEVGVRHPGLRLARSADDVLDDPDIDAVSIATYDPDHFEQVHTALENGKHVFVEKPLCLREEEVEEIARLLAERPDLVLSSNLPLRMSPRFEWLRAAIDRGTLGRLFYLEGDYDYGRLWKLTEGWRGDLDYYSVVLGGAVHLVDLLLWLSGDEVVEVTARGSGVATAGTKFAFDDLVVAILKLRGGGLAKIGANFACVHPHFHGVKVFGTEGTFVNGLPDATLHSRVGGHATRATPITAPYPGVGKGDLIHSFVQAIISGEPAKVTAEEVLTTTAVCLAIDRAVHTGQAVALSPLG